MKSDNYVNIYTGPSKYASDCETYNVKYEGDKQDSAKKTLVKIEDIINRHEFFIGYDVDELKKAASYLVKKYEKDKENFGFFRSILMALDNFFSPLLGRKSYEKQLEDLNKKIQEAEAIPPRSIQEMYRSE